MRRTLPFLFALCALAGLGCPPAPNPIKNKTDDGKVVQKPVDVPADLKPRIELALAQVQSRDLKTTHYFWTVFHGILGSGFEKTMLTKPDKTKVKAIDYIYEGGVIEGMQFLPTKHGLDVLTAKPFDADAQGVAQGHQDQFIAEMAQWNMPIKQTFKVGSKEYKFEDFTNHSRMRASTSPKKNQELSWAIIIVAQYYGTDHQWTNEDGDRLTMDDIVRYELDQPIEKAAACGGTHRLFGLTWAYHLHLKNGGKRTGVWADVEKKIEHYKKRAKELQNPDGTFSTDYFVGPGHADVADLRIGTTGHVVEWLALAMTEDELKSDWMQRAVSALALLIVDRERNAVDGGALYHATHGLHLYHMRVFGTPPDYLPLPPKR